MFVIAEKLLLFKENGCEERSAAGEVHERVMSSDERRCHPQRPWRFLLLRKELSLWHFSRMHMTARAPPPPPVPQVPNGDVPPPLLVFHFTPVYLPYASAHHAGACSPQMWPELRSSAQSDASSITSTHSETCTADRHVSVSLITVATNWLKASAFVLNSSSHTGAFIGRSSWFSTDRIH